MNFYLQAIWNNLKVRKWLTVLIIIELICIILLVAALYNNYQFNKISQQSHIGEYRGNQVYQIADNLVNDKEKEFFSGKEGMQSLILFTNYMTDSKEVNFFNHVAQPIGVTNLRGDDFFINTTDGTINEPYVSENDGLEYDVVSSVQINQSAIELQKVNVQTGRNFEASDFIFSDEQKEFPILLGSEFKKYYKPGDILKIEYLFYPLNGKVVGFIEPNTFLAIGQEEEIYLDKKIVLPMVNFKKVAENEEVCEFQRKQLLHAANGYMVTQMSHDSFVAYMKDVSQQTGFEDYSIIGANMHATNYLSDLIGKSQVYMLIAGITASVLAALSMYFVLVSKVKMSFKNFAIYLTSGFSNKDISRFMLLEGIFLFCVAYIIAILLAILLHLFDPLLFLVLFIFGIFAIWIMMFFLNRKFAAFNPAVFLKEVERLR